MFEGYYLVTVDNWFVGPDGKQYKAVWGKTKVFSDKELGIETNRNSSNWFLRVGSVNNHVIVAGCKVHYAIKCNKQPTPAPIITTVVDNEETKNSNPIYIAK